MQLRHITILLCGSVVSDLPWQEGQVALCVLINNGLSGGKSYNDGILNMQKTGIDIFTYLTN